jgi:release factor glutamine methyltransferase
MKPAAGVTLGEQLAGAARRIAVALGLNADEARLEARILAAHALGVGRAWLIAHDRDQLGDHQAAAIEALLARRLDGEPVAYILGEREFYGRSFRVTPATLIPRPETEHLVEAALQRMPTQQPIDVLDIGTGSGCIAITLKLERPAWQVTAVDISQPALAVAQSNAACLGAEVAFIESDLFSALAGRRFDLIVSNPPYVAAEDGHLGQGDVRFEPLHALASGPEGLNAIRQIVKSAPTHVLPGGWLMLEHGWDQGEAIGKLLTQAGFAEVFLERDLARQARVSGGRMGYHSSPQAKEGGA